MTDSAAGEVRDVRDRHRFDEARLADYLGVHLQGFKGPLAIKQFKGGQSNPTFLLETPDARYVLRKKPPGKLLPSAHAIEREYRIMSALRDTDVPVPNALLLCEDADVIGTPFFVMEWLDGRVFRNPLMPEASGPDERTALGRAMLDTLARLHSVDLDATGLRDFGKPSGYMRRQIERWSKQYEASKTDEIEAMNQLREWLPSHLPESEDVAIAHGDFRLENLIIHPTEPRVLAVLDWELSTLGHPLADLGYNCMLYHLPEGDFAGSGYLGADLDALGILSKDEAVRHYAQATGRSGVDDIDFYVAFGMFRLAAIVQGVYKRGLDGNASSESALRFGPIVHHLASVGWSLTGA